MSREPLRQTANPTVRIIQRWQVGRLFPNLGLRRLLRRLRQRLLDAFRGSGLGGPQPRFPNQEPPGSKRCPHEEQPNADDATDSSTARRRRLGPGLVIQVWVVPDLDLTDVEPIPLVSTWLFGWLQTAPPL